MAQLTGNPIKDSYLGLIKTTDNAAIGATEKQITDGAGNNVPLTVGTAGVSFTGDADFSAATVTGLPASEVDVPNIANGELTRSVSGYGADTYWSACTLTVGRPSLNFPAIDQGADQLLLVPFNITSRFTVTTLGIPMQVLANDTIHVAIFELDDSDGGPGTRVVYETASVTTADNETWYALTLTNTWTPDEGKQYWIGAFSELGASSGAGFSYLSGEADTFQRFTTTNNNSLSFILPLNTLYYGTGGTMPTDLSGTTMGGSRDERLFIAWK